MLFAMVRAARKPLLAALLVFACAGTVSAGAGVSRRHVHITPSNALESQVLTQINTIRAHRGLARLRLSTQLNNAANAHSLEMARLGYFSHSSSNGTAFWKRIARFYPARGFRYWAVGENLLWSSPYVTASDAMKMWMASPEHRRNLLTAQWRDIGLSAVHVQTARGVYGGREVTIITSDFGVRR
jgi:uncharacterized protein YkwD